MARDLVDEGWGVSEQITTAEAAKISHHATAVTFRRWALRNCPHLMMRPAGRRGYLVDRDELLKFLQHYVTSYSTL